MRGKSVLIIDDDMRNIFALSAVLKAKGFVCISAQSADEGFAKLEEQMGGTGVILLDMMMPDMDGYQALQKLKTSAYSEVPVVAVTAQAMTGDRERCLEAGADEYLSKPVDVDRLLTLLKKFLE